MEASSLIKRLTECNAVSGMESELREIIYSEIKDYCTSARVDSMGNLCVYKKGKSHTENTVKVLLSAHMDEVGLIVTDITEDGYLKFDTVGGIDSGILVSQRVVSGEVSGVIALKAVHLTTAEEREKPVTIKQLYIDIGAKDRQSAMRYVSKGDCFAFDSGYVEFGSQIKAKALDDRVGCAAMIEMLKNEWECDLYCNFTVQEEVGLRGARIASRGIKPDYAVVVEATTCNDLPGVGKNLCVTKSGDGPALSILDSASKADGKLVAMLERVAVENGIPYQFKASTAGGNDAGVICLADGGIKTASVSVPCRYIHSPVCVMNKNDYENCKALIKAFLKTVGKDA